MANPADDLARPNRLARGDRHGLWSQVGVERAGVSSLDDHEVPGDRVESAPGRIEGDRVLQGERDLAQQVDLGALGHPAHGRHDLAVEGGSDGLAPPVVVAGAPAEQQGAQGAGWAQVQALAMVGPDEVEGVALSQKVGAVAGDPVLASAPRPTRLGAGTPRPLGPMACASPPPGRASQTRMPERSSGRVIRVTRSRELTWCSARRPARSVAVMLAGLRASDCDRMLEAFSLALPGSATRIVTAGPLLWPMTWPMIWLAQACSGLPGTFADRRYLTQSTQIFRVPVAS